MTATAVPNPRQPNDKGLAFAPAAIDPTNGNSFAPVLNGHANELVFYNGHVSSITVTLKAQNTNSVHVKGVGYVTPADKALVVAAGSIGVFRIEADDMNEYIDAGGLLQVTYTSGNVAMTCALMASP